MKTFAATLLLAGSIDARMKGSLKDQIALAQTQFTDSPEYNPENVSGDLGVIANGFGSGRAASPAIFMFNDDVAETQTLWNVYEALNTGNTNMATQIADLSAAGGIIDQTATASTAVQAAIDTVKSSIQT